MKPRRLQTFGKPTGSRRSAIQYHEWFESVHAGTPNRQQRQGQTPLSGNGEIVLPAENSITFKLLDSDETKSER